MNTVHAHLFTTHSLWNGRQQQQEPAKHTEIFSFGKTFVLCLELSMIEVISHDESVLAVKLLFIVCVWELVKMVLRNLLFTSCFSATHTNVIKFIS